MSTVLFISRLCFFFSIQKWTGKTSSQRQVLRSRSIIVKFTLHWKIQLHDNSYTSALEADWLSLRQYQMGVATPLSPYTCKFLQIKVIVIVSHQKGTLSFFSRFHDTKGIHFSSICNSAGTFVYKFTFTFAKSIQQVTLFDKTRVDTEFCDTVLCKVV